jgi:hypothetical protein
MFACILNVILINSVFASSEKIPDFTPPDFSQAGIFHNSNSNNSYAPPSPSVPTIVQKKFKELSMNEFKDSYEGLSNYGWDKEFENHPEKHFFAIKIQLPNSFKNKELYFLQITQLVYFKFPKFFFIFYDPQKNVCSVNPLILNDGDLMDIKFDDLLGDGKEEIGFKTFLPDGSVHFTNTRYYSCEEDLSFKEIFAYGNSMESGQCKNQTEILNIKNGIITLSVKEHCDNPEYPTYDNYDNNYVINYDVKKFEPLKAEKDLSTYFDNCTSNQTTPTK